MNAVAARSATRGLAGLAWVALALTALVLLVPGKEPAPTAAWSPPAEVAVRVTG